MGNETSKIIKSEEKRESDRLKRTLTVVLANLKLAYMELERVDYNCMGDPLYFEFAEGIMKELRSTIRKLEDKAEELRLDISILDFG